MAHSQLDARPPLKGASAMGAYVPITFIVAGAGGSSLSETVLPAGSYNDLPFGVTLATVASAGDPVSYWRTGDVAKCVAGASLGAGCQVAVGSSNGVLIPLAPTGGAASANLVSLRWSVGIAMKNAAAGDQFPVYVKPDQIV